MKHISHEFCVLILVQPSVLDSLSCLEPTSCEAKLGAHELAYSLQVEKTMAYPIRFIEADQPYFVTARTIQGRFLLRPDALVNELIGSILARGVRIYGVQLFDFVFTSNHFHLIMAAATPKKFVSFMQFLLSNIAVKVGRLVNWRARFWDRRYSCEPILDDDAFIARARYIKAHGVKEKLVARVEDWPGLTARPELTEGAVRSFPWRS